MALPPPSPWMPENDKIRLAVLGKFAEELGECIEAAANVSAGGFYAKNAVGDRTYSEELVNEIADVISGVTLVCAEFYDDKLPDPKVIEDAGISEVLVALARCSTAVARCIIQGIDESHPVTKRPNKIWLDWAMNDVVALGYGMLYHQVPSDTTHVPKRIIEKVEHKQAWHELILLELAKAQGTKSLDDFKVVCHETPNKSPDQPQTWVTSNTLPSIEIGSVRRPPPSESAVPAYFRPKSALPTTGPIPYAQLIGECECSEGPIVECNDDRGCICTRCRKPA